MLTKHITKYIGYSQKTKLSGLLINQLTLELL